MLVTSGNWQRVGNNDVSLFLDMYVQSLLLKMAQHTGSITPELLEFVATIPERDILGIAKGGAEAAVAAGFKHRSFAEGTPLLLRCCIAMDEKDGTNAAQTFLDGMTRVLYAAAEADGSMDSREMQFITTYSGGLRTFLLSRLAKRHTSFEKPWVPQSHPAHPKAEKQVETKPEVQKLMEVGDERTLDELVAELDQLIGLSEVKKEVHSLMSLIKVREMRRAHGLQVMDMSFHMVFTGNPGTGKTTVARLVAKIYQKLGFLSKGQLIETDRSGLVAGYVGQTAAKVTEVVTRALGGILFIDEAYSLAQRGAENDFGHEAIDTLVKLMEDNREDLVVIVAGYTEPMHGFLTSNPGLISRFNKYIDFPDYTDDELMKILQMNAERQGYAPTQEALCEVQRMLRGMTLSERMDFGNARGMRNVLEKMVQAQANRIAAQPAVPTREELMEIRADDVRDALELSPIDDPSDEAIEIPEADRGEAGH